MVITVQQKFEVIKMYQQGTPAVEIAKEKGVSLRSVFYWTKRFDGSLDSLENKKRGPRNAERKVSGEDEREILELRVAKGWGYRRIMWYFKRRKGKSLSKNTIRYWIRKHLIPARKRRKHKRRTRTRSLPNDKWIIDIKEHRISDVGRVYTFVGIDDYSRRKFAYSYKRKSAGNAIDFIKRLVCEVGLMKRLQMDNGTQFVYVVKKKRGRGRPRKNRKPRRKTNKFGRFVKSLGIKLKFIDFGKFGQNSKIERAIRTLKEEFLEVEKFKDLDDLNARLALYLKGYNEEREHGSLNGLTPMDVWNGKSIK